MTFREEFACGNTVHVIMNIGIYRHTETTFSKLLAGGGKKSVGVFIKLAFHINLEAFRPST